MNENVVMMCFHWFYSYVLVIWTQYFSQFFTRFFKGLRRICSRAKVGNLVFIICSLPVGTDCVTDKSKGIEWKLHFLKWKTRSFVVNLFCTTLEIAFWSFQISNFSGEAWPQTTSPPYRQLLYSNLLASSIFTKNPYINLSNYDTLHTSNRQLTICPRACACVEGYIIVVWPLAACCAVNASGTLTVVEGAILTRERIETTPRAIDTTINKNETRAVIDCNKV